MLAQSLQRIAGAAAIFASLASPVEACWLFDWLTPWRGSACSQPINYGYQPTNYNGAGACNACTPCAQRVCNYVPQTCYRTVMVPVAVTSYRPTTTYDPCTGCPRTCMTPVASYVQQPRQVPYTTYRQVCQTNSVGSSAAYAPYSAPSGCSSCGSAAAPPANAAGAVGLSPPSLNDYPNAGNPNVTNYPPVQPMPPVVAPPVDRFPRIDVNKPPAALSENPNEHSVEYPPKNVPPADVNGDPMNEANSPSNSNDDGTQLNGPASGASGLPVWKNPRDRTAMRPQWTFTRISWPKSSTTTDGPATFASRKHIQPVNSHPRANQPRTIQLDDSGWRSAGK